MTWRPKSLQTSPDFCCCKGYGSQLFSTYQRCCHLPQFKGRIFQNGLKFYLSGCFDVFTWFSPSSKGFWLIIIRQDTQHWKNSSWWWQIALFSLLFGQFFPTLAIEKNNDFKLFQGDATFVPQWSPSSPAFSKSNKQPSNSSRKPALSSPSLTTWNFSLSNFQPWGLGDVTIKIYTRKKSKRTEKIEHI